MTRRALARILGVALLLTAPVPYFLVEFGFEPVASLLEKLGFTLVLISAEGGAGAITLAAWILGVQILLAAATLWLLARVVATGLERMFGERAAVAVLALVTFLVVVCCVVPIYRTPFRTGGIQSTLPEVFE